MRKKEQHRGRVEAHLHSTTFTFWDESPVASLSKKKKQSQDAACRETSSPALRREGMATQRTRSSSSRHCLAIRMATKVASESWKDKSLT